MAKRKEEAPDEGSPAWMSTFSDLMNLLLCFFVLLFASSSVDEEKIQKIAVSFNQASFSILEEGAISLVDGVIMEAGVTQIEMTSILEYIQATTDNGNNKGTGDSEGATSSETNGTESMENTESTSETSTEETNFIEQYREEGYAQSEMMYEEISDMLEASEIRDDVIMDYNNQYVELNMNGAILFDAGSAEIKDEAKPLMDKIGDILVKYRNCTIEIEGHTDNIPINTAQFQSNRYLSTARATKVYEFLIERKDLIDGNIQTAGYGESRPIASNETEEGRAKNRRVTINIYNQLSSQ